MFVLLTISCLLCLTGVTWAQIDCTGLADGAYGSGCRSYTNCTNGVGTIVDCSIDTAFSSITHRCEPLSQVPPPCGQLQDCSLLANGRYPVMPDCYYFFTCQNGVHMGTNPCNNPPEATDLVLDVALQLCNWKSAVPPPCGTLFSRASSGQGSAKMGHRSRPADAPALTLY
jgi:hypothetical protein